MNIISPDALKKYEFAKGKCNMPANLQEDVRIGYITPEGIHFELNQVLAEGIKFNLKNKILDKYLNSNQIKIKRSGNYDIYYDFFYNADAELMFVEEPDYEQYEKEREEFIEEVKKKNKGVPEDIVEAEIRTALVDYPDAQTLKKTKEEEREENKEIFAEWVEDNKGEGSPKKSVKILVIDQEMEFLENLKIDLSNLPFSLRYLDDFSEDFETVQKLRPHLITYTIKDSKGDPSLVEEIKTQQEEILKELFNKILNIKGYKPVIILFNSKAFSIEELKQSSSYQHIIGFPGQVNLKDIIKMGDLMVIKEKQKKKEEERKRVESLRKQGKKTDTQESNNSIVYLGKANNRGQICYPIEIRTISETALSFATTTELGLGTFQLDNPLDIFVTTIPIEGKKYLKDGSFFIYSGLIHGWDEDGKKGLRRVVDKIFLKEKAEKEAKEKEEFEKKNQEVIQQQNQIVNESESEEEEEEED